MKKKIEAQNTEAQNTEAQNTEAQIESGEYKIVEPSKEAIEDILGLPISQPEARLYFSLRKKHMTTRPAGLYVSGTTKTGKNVAELPVFAKDIRLGAAESIAIEDTICKSVKIQLKGDGAKHFFNFAYSEDAAEFIERLNAGEIIEIMPEKFNSTIQLFMFFWAAVCVGGTVVINVNLEDLYTTKKGTAPNFKIFGTITKDGKHLLTYSQIWDKENKRLKTPAEVLSLVGIEKALKPF